MEFKYSEELSEIERTTSVVCVGASYKEEDRQSFRWTFENIEDSRNFLPRAILVDNSSKEQYTRNCKGWGLSFFLSKEFAVKELKRLCGDKSKLYKKLGTHIAEGEINKSDGVVGGINLKSGHFTLFEYKGTVLQEKFEIIEVVFKNNDDWT